jgi:membrane-associated phospholipid phosphatase
LICVLVAAVGVGVYEIGHHVDSESASLASHDSELGQKVYRPAHKSGPSRHTIELAAGAVGGAAGVIVLISLTSALTRPSRRKATWRAS